MLIKVIKTQWTFFGAAVFLVAVMAGCFGQNEIPEPSRVRVTMELDNIGTAEQITAGDDEITIGRIQLLHEGSFFRLGEDSLYLLNNSDAQSIELFDPQSENPKLLASGNLFKGEYQLLNIQFPQADSINSEADVDSIFTDGGLFSLIVEGQYNGADFTYKSERSFETIQNFSPSLDVPEFDESYEFRVFGDLADWFTSTDGASLLNPSDTLNSDSIDDNIADSFTISVSEGVTAQDNGN